MAKINVAYQNNDLAALQRLLDEIGHLPDQVLELGFGQVDGPLAHLAGRLGEEIRPAAHLWGMDTYDVQAPIRQETDERAVVACIGTAAERGVPIRSLFW